MHALVACGIVRNLGDEPSHSPENRMQFVCEIFPLFSHFLLFDYVDFFRCGISSEIGISKPSSSLIRSG